MKLTVKPNVAHVVKADRLSSVLWKDILDVHCTDRVTDVAWTVSVAWSPHRFLKRWQSVFPLFIGSICRVIVVFCRCLCVDDVAIAVLSDRDVLCALRAASCCHRVLRSRLIFGRRSSEEFRLKIEDFQPLVVLVVLCHLPGKLLVIHRL